MCYVLWRLFMMLDEKEDYYAASSSRLASLYFGRDAFGVRVGRIIGKEATPDRIVLDERDQLLYDIYKGADSMDIMRVCRFDESRNPLMKRAGGKDVQNVSMIEGETIYAGYFPGGLRERRRGEPLRDAIAFMIWYGILYIPGRITETCSRDRKKIFFLREE